LVLIYTTGISIAAISNSFKNHFLNFNSFSSNTRMQMQLASSSFIPPLSESVEILRFFFFFFFSKIALSFSEVKRKDMGVQLEEVKRTCEEGTEMQKEVES
jgi:hypothetical protein